MLHTKDIADAEREKYSDMWDIPQYSDYSPGLESVECFMKVMKPKPNSSIVDIGCGKGVAGLEFAKRGLQVSYVDLVRQVPDEINSYDFIEAPLWQDWAQGMKWDYGYCCDVLEHIPPEFTMLVIDRILACCSKVWLQIAFIPDGWGAVIGKELHLTVQPFTWWRDRIDSIGLLNEARDLCGRGLFIVKGGNCGQDF